MTFPKDHWMHKAMPGELHKRLGLKQGTKIPTKLLLQASKSGENDGKKPKTTKEAMQMSLKNTLGEEVA